MKKSIICILLLSFFIACPLYAAKDIETTRVELAEINSKLNLKQNKLDNIRKEEKRILQKLTKIKSELRYAQNNLRHSKNRLQQDELRLNQLEKELKIEEHKLNLETERFQQRIREIYKNQNLGYFEFFFSSTTLGDFISRSYFFEKIILKDVEIIRKLRDRQKKVQDTKNYMNRKVNEIRRLTHTITREKQKIEKQVDQEKKVYGYIYSQRLAYEKEIAELQRNSAEIENLLKQLLLTKKQVKLMGTGKHMWPIDNKKFWISSSYGYRRHPIFRVVRFHTGLDLAANRGVPVMAADSGEVVFTGAWGGYGKAIIINHGNSYSTVYAHLSRIYVQKGQAVVKGSKVGLVGSTGYATGPHLHFEIRKNGQPVNPIHLLPKR
ncbi:MAG: peptidoglycan DD-metalloendopeptidase family protein [Candidatus Margulisiibacteriota bacterium]